MVIQARLCDALIRVTSAWFSYVVLALLFVLMLPTSGYANPCPAGSAPVYSDPIPDDEHGATYVCVRWETTIPDTYEPPTVGETAAWNDYVGTPPYVPVPNQERGEGDSEDSHGVCMAGNPVSLTTGNKYQAEVDFTGTGYLPLTIERHYNSLGAYNPLYKGIFGQGITQLLFCKFGNPSSAR